MGVILLDTHLQSDVWLPFQPLFCELVEDMVGQTCAFGAICGCDLPEYIS